MERLERMIEREDERRRFVAVFYGSIANMRSIYERIR
jgi:hypothetical protein